MDDKLKAAVDAVQAKFDALEANAKALYEKRSAIDREIGQIREEQVRLQGEFRALKSLMGEGEATEKKSDE